MRTVKRDKPVNNTISVQDCRQDRIYGAAWKTDKYVLHHFVDRWFWPSIAKPTASLYGHSYRTFTEALVAALNCGCEVSQFKDQSEFGSWLKGEKI